MKSSLRANIEKNLGYAVEDGEFAKFTALMFEKSFDKKDFM